MAKKVIVEYRGQNRTEVIESAAMRRAREYHESRMRRRAKMVKVNSEMVGSVQREGSHRAWYQGGLYSDLKSWKNQKHARKSWMRHLHRLSPSARVLADNCIYPNTTC